MDASVDLLMLSAKEEILKTEHEKFQRLKDIDPVAATAQAHKVLSIASGLLKDSVKLLERAVHDTTN